MTIETERQLVERALADAGLHWTDWPACATTGGLGDRAVLATLILLLSERQVRPRFTVEILPWGPPEPSVIDRLRKRRLPWDAATARLALDVAMAGTGFDDTGVTIALRGAEAVCAAGAADVALLDLLDRCRRWLDDLSGDLWAVPETRRLVRRVIAAAAPPDLLDLSLVVDGDGWGAPARAAASAADPDAARRLVRRLGELGARKPSQRWLSECADILRDPAAAILLRRWLELAADAPIVEADETLAFAGGMLFAPGNDDLVRAAVLATGVLAAETWVPPILGVLARRGAASSYLPAMTAALALKVASAAVGTLAARGTPGDRAVLEELLEDLSRRDLVRRVGVALGRQDEAARRNDEIRRAKAVAVRSKADPRPRHDRATADVLIRRHVLPVLRATGFVGRGRTWRRFHPDRVDVVGIGSSGSEVSVGYGTWFDAVHPEGELYPVPRGEVRHGQLDVTLSFTGRASDRSLAPCARTLAEDVVPFLDGLGRYEGVRAYLESGAGVPSGSMAMDNPGSPMVLGVLGLLARAAGDDDTAVGCLTQRLAFVESLEPMRDDQARHEAEAGFWRAQLERARRGR